MILKFKKLHENAVLPFYATKFSAGMDLTATTCEWSDENQCWIYGTGLAVEIPTGKVGLLFPRSSVRKTSLSMANCVGVIDSDYRGEIMASFKEFGHKHYGVGERICQMVIVDVQQYDTQFVDELSTTDRGEGGHGSTGK